LVDEHGTYLSPKIDLVYQDYFDNRYRFFGIGNYTSVAFARMKEARRAGIDTFIRMLANPSIKIVLGTNATAGAHGGNVEKLVARVEDGCQDEMTVILSATSVATESLGLADKVGTIAVGLWADLLAVGGNPLDDIKHVRNVRFVMKGGQAYQNSVRPVTASAPVPQRR
jgi:imidazolonepropionase-like amidohydrolase